MLFRLILREKGISARRSPPYAPLKDDIAKKINRTILNMLRVAKVSEELESQKVEEMEEIKQ